MQLLELGSGEYWILCICEGNAEIDVMNMLLDSDKLIFQREHLLNNTVIRREKVKKIQEDYLSYRHTKPLAILRIIDSKSEKFNLCKVYKERYDDKIFSIYTTPEIEILMIVHKGHYHKYSQKNKSNQKPSVYCKCEYGLKDIKKSGTFEKFFADADSLVKAIHSYNSLTKNHDLTLLDLIK